jgi:soluble lytic murein transglycosylase-like protein
VTAFERVEQIRASAQSVNAVVFRNQTSFDAMLEAAVAGGPRLDVPSDPRALAIRAGTVTREEVEAQADAEARATAPAPAVTVPETSTAPAVTGPETATVPGVTVPETSTVPAVTVPETSTAPAVTVLEPAHTTPNSGEAIEVGAAPAPPPATPAAGAWSAGLPERGQQWAASIEAAATRHGLEPQLLGALVWSESAFDPQAVSSAGAIGLAQLMPATAAGLGVDPRDPLQNLEGGARYLREQLDRFGSFELGLAAYNAGPTRVARAGGVPAIAETRAYVQVVLDRYVQLGGRR